MSGDSAVRTSAPASKPAAAVTIGVLGPLAVTAAGRLIHVAGGHRRRLLAFLASRPGHSASTDAIIAALWGEDPPPSAHKTLQSHVVRLRQSFGALDPNPIVTVPGGYRLDVSGDAIDAENFERLARAGHERLQSSDFEGAVPQLTAALDLWRGRAYQEFVDVEFARVAAVHLDDLRLAVIEDLAESELGFGSVVRAAHRLERLLGEEGGRERGWGLLMRALYASGRQHDALKAFQRAHRFLADYGIEPGPELRSIERQIVAQDPQLLGGSGRTLLAAALQSSTPMVGRRPERDELWRHWLVASGGRGRTVVVRGAIDAGRTRLAAQLAGRVIGRSGVVEYLRGADGFTPLGRSGDSGPSEAAVVDALAERCRRGALLLILDDIEWLPPSQAPALSALAQAVEDLPMLIVAIVDPSAGGAVVNALQRIERATAHTIELAPMSDEEIGAIISADGLSPEAVRAVTATAGGLPGVARREAAAWAEATAGDRLRTAAASSVDSQDAAARAQESVLDEVLELVAARNRRDSMRSEKWAGRQPYRSLAAYGPQDAELFVGRERLVAELAARVLERRLIVVVGPSGSGKSSLVRAGLLPLARSGRLPGGREWRTSVILPGRDPIRALETISGLDEPGTQLLVVDQFEEVFASPAETVDAFVGRLVDLTMDCALDVRIVLTVRADALGALSAVPGLAPVLEGGQVVLGGPTDDEIRRIVEEPARRTGVTVEPDLVDLVAADVVGHEAALPLVSAAMAEVWQQRDGSVLRAERYVAIGGISSAVERLGEGVVGRIGETGIVPLRSLLLSLATITDEDVWERVRLDVEAIPDDQREALDALVDARLVMRSDTTAEIVHEVVFRAWPRLAAWLDAAQAGKHVERDVVLAARAWDLHGRSDDDVIRGARLAAALEWAGGDDWESSPLLRDFLARSDALRRAEQEATAARLAAEQRSNRRLRRLLRLAAVLLVLTILGGAVALVQRNTAEEQRRDARTAREVAEAERDQARVERLVAESERQLARRVDVAFLLAVEARRRQDSPETRGALWTALTRHAVGELPSALDMEWARITSIPPKRTHSAFLGFIDAPTRIVRNLAVSDDSTRIVGSGFSAPDATAADVTVFDVATREPISSFTVESRGFTEAPSLEISPDGRHVAARQTGPAVLFDTSTGRASEIPVDDGDGEVRAMTFLSNSRLLVTQQTGVHSLWDVATIRPTDEARPPAGRIAGRVGEDTYVVVTTEFEVLFWERAADRIGRTLKLERPTEASAGPLESMSLVVSPDGASLAAAAFQGPLLAWNLASGERRPTPPSVSGVRGIVFEPAEPDVVVVNTALGGLQFVDLERNLVIAKLNVHGGGGFGVAVGADGSLMASSSEDGNIGLWGDASERTLVSERLARGAFNPMYSADGTRILVSTVAGGLEVRDGSRPDTPGTPITAPPDAPADFTRAMLSADGNRVVATTGLDDADALFVADAGTGEVLWTMPPEPDFHLLMPSISADGRRVAVNGAGEQLRVYDVDSGEELARTDRSILDVGDAILGDAALFSADGQHLDIAIQPAGPMRLRASDLSVVSRPTTAQASQGWVVEIPGSDDGIGFGGQGELGRWNLQTGELIASGRSREATSFYIVGVSPDGNVAAGHHVFTGSMALFDTTTMRPIGAPFPTHPGISPISFTPDSTRLAHSGPYNEAMSWDIDPDSWEATACRAVGRNLTREEWFEYIGPDEPYRRTCEDWPAGV